MKTYPKAYYKKGGNSSAFVDGKRVACTKIVAHSKEDADKLTKDGWLSPVAECFKKAQAKKAGSNSKPKS